MMLQMLLVDCRPVLYCSAGGIYPASLSVAIVEYLDNNCSIIGK